MSTIYEPSQAEIVSYGTPNYETTPTTEAVVEAQPPVEQPPQPEEAVVVEPQAAEVVPSQEAVAEVEISEQERIFKEMFEKTFGMAPEDLKTQLEQTQTERQRLEAERQLTQLQQEWGVDEEGLSHRLALISERLNKLPEATRQALDNYEGINLVWAALSAESNSGVPSNPRYEKSTVAAPAAQRPMFTKAQLSAMSSQEYAARNAEILYAYQNNLIQ